MRTRTVLGIMVLVSVAMLIGIDFGTGGLFSDPIFTQVAEIAPTVTSESNEEPTLVPTATGTPVPTATATVTPMPTATLKPSICDLELLPDNSTVTAYREGFDHFLLRYTTWSRPSSRGILYPNASATTVTCEGLTLVDYVDGTLPPVYEVIDGVYYYLRFDNGCAPEGTGDICGDMIFLIDAAAFEDQVSRELSLFEYYGALEVLVHPNIEAYYWGDLIPMVVHTLSPPHVLEGDTLEEKIRELRISFQSLGIDDSLVDYIVAGGWEVSVSTHLWGELGMNAPMMPFNRR